MKPECSICTEFYDNGNKSPMVLSCGHSFCKNCLTSVLKSANRICSLCRTPIQQNIFQIPRNVALLNVIQGTEDNEKIYNINDMKDPPTSGIAVMDTQKFFQENSEFLFQAKPRLERILYAKYMKNADGSFRFYFQPEKPQEKELPLISWDSLVLALNEGGTQTLPVDMFLTIFRKESFLGELRIRLTLPLTFAAANFLILASGLKPPRSYKGAVFSRNGFSAVDCEESLGIHIPVINVDEDAAKKIDHKYSENVCVVTPVFRDGNMSSTFKLCPYDIRHSTNCFGKVFNLNGVIGNIKYGDYIKECGFIL